VKAQRPLTEEEKRMQALQNSSGCDGNGPPPPAPERAHAPASPLSATSLEHIAALVPQYLDSCRTRLDQATEASDRGDLTTVRHHAHALRGSGGAFGFDAISEIAARLEDAALAENLRRVATEIAALQRLLEDIRP